MTGAGLARFDAHGRMVWANPTFAGSLGVSGGVSGGMNDAALAELIEAALRDGALADPDGRDADALLGDLAEGALAVLRRRGGAWVALSMAEDGEGGRLLSVARTTAPEGAAVRLRAVQERQALLETAFDTMIDAIAGFDSDLRLVLWNRNYAELSRLPDGMIRVGTHFAEIVHAMAERGDYGPVDAGSFTAERVAAARSAEPFHFQFTLWGDRVFDARHLPLPGGGFLRRYVDITDRARAEEAQRAVLEAIAVPLVVTRLADGKVVLANQPALEFFGRAREEVLGALRAPDVYVDPAERRRILDALRAGGGRLQAFETRMFAAGGREAWVLLSIRRFRFHGEDALLACVSDISDRRRAERELAESRELFELAIRAARDGISRWDLDTGTLWFSPQWWALLGYGEDEMVNTIERWSELVLPEDRDVSLRMARDFIDGVTDECQLVQRFRHKAGGTVYFYTRAVKVTDAEGRPVRLVGSHTDITERIRADEAVRAAKEQAEQALHDLKQAQAHLIQTEKMAALGSLVAGVAHEINTPVGIALTGASLLAERTDEIRRAFDDGRLRKSDLADYLETAGEASQLMMLNVDRAAQLIQSFKQMAVDQASGERRAFNLRDYIHEVLRSLGVRLKRAAHGVEVSCPEDLVLDGYPGALSQLLTNLVMNSLAHAYVPGEQGQLRIAARCLDGDRVELVYADDGRGIPPELHARVFEPFFTTSRGSGGSGLGLNIVYNIATRTLKGRIALDSAPGQGATFTVTFPRVA